MEGNVADFRLVAIEHVLLSPRIAAFPNVDVAVRTGSGQEITLRIHHRMLNGLGYRQALIDSAAAPVDDLDIGVKAQYESARLGAKLD
jgi:hypothetical protein